MWWKVQILEKELLMQLEIFAKTLLISVALPVLASKATPFDRAFVYENIRCGTNIHPHYLNDLAKILFFLFFVQSVEHQIIWRQNHQTWMGIRQGQCVRHAQLKLNWMNEMVELIKFHTERAWNNITHHNHTKTPLLFVDNLLRTKWTQGTKKLVNDNIKRVVQPKCCALSYEKTEAEIDCSVRAVFCK